MSDTTARTFCPRCERPATIVLGSCSECGESVGGKPSLIETQVQRQRAHTYSASGEWWEMWWGFDWGMRLAVSALVGGLSYLLFSLL